MEIMLKLKGRKKCWRWFSAKIQEKNKNKKTQKTSGLLKTVRSMRKSQKQSRAAECIIVVVFAKVVADCSRRR
jgi:hypothetical protein